MVVTSGSENPAGFGSHGEISRAIGAASAGNHVLVGPGTFTDNLSINKSLTLLGDGQATTTIIPAVSMLA